jgi:hypothetical protein
MERTQLAHGQLTVTDQLLVELIRPTGTPALIASCGRYSPQLPTRANSQTPLPWSRDCSPRPPPNWPDSRPGGGACCEHHGWVVRQYLVHLTTIGGDGDHGL